MENKNLFCIYTRKVAVKLRERGFNIVKTGVNPRFPQFDCYFFVDTEDFQKELTNITKEIKRKEE